MDTIRHVIPEDFQDFIKELRMLPLDVMEPCEINCDAIRHARHIGSWQTHIRAEKYIQKLLLKYGIDKNTSDIDN